MQETVLPKPWSYTSQSVIVAAQAGLERYPYFDKLWLMLGQLEERQGAAAAARQAYQNGLKRCITSVPLWRVRCHITPCSTCTCTMKLPYWSSHTPHCVLLLHGGLAANSSRLCESTMRRRRRGWRSRRATCRRHGRRWSKRGTRTRAASSCGWRPCARSSAPPCPRPPTPSWPRRCRCGGAPQPCSSCIEQCRQQRCSCIVLEACSVSCDSLY